MKKPVPIHPAAELLPPMTDAEFQALKEDLAVNGLQESIKLLDGKLLDGRHRQRGCDELGIEPRYEDLPAATDPVAYVYSKAVHRNLTESQKAAAAVAILDARQTETKAKSAANLKQNKAKPWHTGTVFLLNGEERIIAKYPGPGLVTITGRGSKSDQRQTFPVEDLAELLKGTKWEVGSNGNGAEVETVPPGTNGNGIKARDVVGSLFGVSGRYIEEARKVRDADPKLFQEVFNGSLPLTRARRAIHRSEKRKRNAALAKTLPPHVDGTGIFELHRGDCVKVMETWVRGFADLVVADSPTTSASTTARARRPTPSRGRSSSPGAANGSCSARRSSSPTAACG